MPTDAPAHADKRTAVIVAAYNAATTLRRAIDSALREPEVVEVCIVDDGSTDQTPAIANDIAAADRRVRVVWLNRNAGPGAARNAAIEATTAPWIAILDSDDHLLEGRFAALHAFTADADFVADALIRTPMGVEPAFTRRALAPRALDFAAFVLGNLGGDKRPLDLGFMKPLMRRSFLDSHRLKYRPDMRLGEDYDLYGRALALRARFITCGEAGYVSVERPGSLSKDHSAAELRLLRDCDDDIERLGDLTKHEKRALARHRSGVDCRLQWARLISAVKARDVAAMASTVRSPTVALYLANKLAEQAWLRSTGRGPHSKKKS
jgi:succinoglycan biosynthesis protein ExoU